MPVIRCSKKVPVTGLPLASVTETIDCVTGFPLASIKKGIFNFINVLTIN